MAPTRIFRILVLFIALLGACNNAPTPTPAPSDPTPTPTTPLALQGQVADATGKWLPGAMINLYTQTEYSEVQPTGSTTSESEGRFGFEQLADGEYTLIATTPSGSAGIQRGIDITAGKHAKHLTVIVREPGVLYGTVAVGYSNEALTMASNRSDVRVSIPGTGFYTHTDHMGAYRLTGVPAGEHTVLFTKPGYTTATLTSISLTAGTELQLPLVTLTGPGSSPNQPPVANFSVTPKSGPTPLTVQLDAIQSYDPDGTISNYEWSTGNQHSSGRTASFVLEEIRVHTIVLTVTDNDGAQAQASRTVTVTPIAEEPGPVEPEPEPSEPGDPNPDPPEPEPGQPGISNPSPSTLSLSGSMGSSVSGAFSFENLGTADLNWSISGQANLGLTVSPAAGVLSSNAVATVTVSGTCDGDITGALTIHSNDPQREHVTVWISTSCRSTPPSGSFDIELDFVGSSVTPRMRSITNAAADRWSEIITSDLPEVSGFTKAAGACGVGEPAVNNRTVDDLLIHVMVEDLSGNTIGRAGPCYFYGTRLPHYGVILLDRSFINRTSDAGLLALIMHEMGHVLGIGTLWELETFDLLDYAPSSACRTGTRFTRPPSFTGQAARNEYGDLVGAVGPLNVPVEDEGGGGTRCGHWKQKGVFGNELMTGTLINPNHTPISRVTIASLEDLGYTVDLSKADAFTLSAVGMLDDESGDAELIELHETLIFPTWMPNE